MADLMKRLNKYYRYWIIYHILFWLIMLLSFFVDIAEYWQLDITAFTISIFIRLCLIAILMYGNLYLLIPLFFNKRRFFIYFLLLGLLITGFSLSYHAIYFKTNSETFELNSDWRFVLNVFLALRFLFISFLFIFLKTAFEKEKELSQVKLDKIKTELDYLRAQVNPHFLFNTLNNLYGLALKKSDKAPEAIMRLADIMDYMLYTNDDLKVPLSKEIRNVENYIELEKLRQGNNAAISFVKSGQEAGLAIVPSLLLPLVENGFKHGINQLAKGAYINISANVTDNKLSFYINNNKPDNKNPDGHGIGIRNLKNRLDFFYKERHTLSIKETVNTFSVKLTITLL
jgi:two-component system LytT family sensor kinase